MIKYALRYATTKGLRVLPVAGPAYSRDERASKQPLIGGGVHSATTDEATIREWWTRWPLANVAVAIPPEWWVLDVDPKNGGLQKLAVLEEQYDRLPITPTQRSGSGGIHMLFAKPDGELRGRIEPGIDVLGDGRYFICAPSIHWSGGVYQWTSPKGIPIAQTPDWLARLVTHVEVPRPTPTPRRVTHSTSPSEITMYARAQRYVAMMDPAISGQGGHAATFRVALALVKGFGLSEDEALTILRDYNGRCKPPWSEAELRHKIESAVRRGHRESGQLANAPRRSA